MRASAASGEIVLLALGANLGDALGQIRAAVDALAEKLSDVRTSAVYRTPPVGAVPQPDYFNAVVWGRTDRSPRETLRLASELEEAARRTRPYPNAPRTLDVDLLFHGTSVIHEGDLEVPHPRWSQRAFVVVPLLDVASAWRDPESGRTVADVAAANGWTMEEFPRVVEPGDILRSRVP